VPEAQNADVAGLTQLVRAWDRPRYYATLFAPEAIRADLFTLYGFAAEIARVPDLVSDATIGEIRLQFWRDQLEASNETGGEGGPPTLQAIAGVIARRRLPLAPLLALVDARRADLYGDPPATFGDIEGYFGETQSALFQMAAIVAGGEGAETADLAGHAGVAYGLAHRLAAFPADRARGRTVLSADRLAAEGMTGADVFAVPSSPVLAKVVSQVTLLARHHLDEARKALIRLPRGLDTVFLPLAVVAPLLDRIERLGPAIVSTPAGLSDFESLIRLSWAKLRGV
jgi:phytoene synthase